MSSYQRFTGICPACGTNMDIAKYHCSSCNTEVSGRFDTCQFCRLDPDMQRFVTVFIVNRGNIKLVEKSLGISYPTVRKELKRVIKALGYAVEEDSSGPSQTEKLAVLDQLERGEIEYSTAIALMEKEE